MQRAELQSRARWLASCSSTGPGIGTSAAPASPGRLAAVVAAARVRGLDGNTGLKLENSALAYQAASTAWLAMGRAAGDGGSRGRAPRGALALEVPTKGAYFLIYPRRPGSRARSRCSRSGSWTSGAGAGCVADVARASRRRHRRFPAGPAIKYPARSRRRQLPAYRERSRCKASAPASARPGSIRIDAATGRIESPSAAPP